MDDLQYKRKYLKYTSKYYRLTKDIQTGGSDDADVAQVDLTDADGELTTGWHFVYGTNG